ncbi:hypothetical protein EXW34_31410 (plasmid) [Bacillus mycoides]|uniref:S-Ena type endospore appendage n=1 Tax=Bacillus mycoides TaxID=1405 RepID=UPI001C00A3DC|nr:S-Ena type endospore appendage [Bacillus mycoides]QWI25679.1 hypothetical protein EXW34_31410 [Bacillus mycoides]HDR4948338.1 hypothetical protein [Bacillus cereus]
MCNSNNGDCCCCPPAQMLQEKICGNFNGPLTGIEVWSAPAGGYSAGTFEIFNSAASLATVTAAIVSNPAGALSAGPGNSDSQSVNQPTSFVITAGVGDSGTYCITLYKRVLA